jgi:hypothetical protein
MIAAGHRVRFQQTIFWQAATRFPLLAKGLASIALRHLGVPIPRSASENIVA